MSVAEFDTTYPFSIPAIEDDDDDDDDELLALFGSCMLGCKASGTTNSRDAAEAYDGLDGLDDDGPEQHHRKLKDRRGFDAVVKRLQDAYPNITETIIRDTIGGKEDVRDAINALVQPKKTKEEDKNKDKLQPAYNVTTPPPPKAKVVHQSSDGVTNIPRTAPDPEITRRGISQTNNTSADNLTPSQMVEEIECLRRVLSQTTTENARLSRENAELTQQLEWVRSQIDCNTGMLKSASRTISARKAEYETREAEIEGVKKELVEKEVALQRLLKKYNTQAREVVAKDDLLFKRHFMLVEKQKELGMLKERFSALVGITKENVAVNKAYFDRAANILQDLEGVGVDGPGDGAAEDDEGDSDRLMILGAREIAYSTARSRRLLGFLVQSMANTQRLLLDMEKEGQNEDLHKRYPKLMGFIKGQLDSFQDFLEQIKQQDEAIDVLDGAINSEMEQDIDI